MTEYIALSDTLYCIYVIIRSRRAVSTTVRTLQQGPAICKQSVMEEGAAGLLNRMLK